MSDDLSSYQSSNTAWRYDNRLARLRDEIANLEQILANGRAELARLEANPPMHELFNWSA